MVINFGLGESFYFAARIFCLEHLLFIGYLLLFAWLVTRTGFFRHSGLTAPQLVIFFLLKVMAGIIYGWIGVYYGELAQMVDTWSYHAESLEEYELLLSKPGEFVTSLFRNSYENGYTRFLSENSWWNDLKANFFIKILAIFNLFSFGSYYINVIFYAFLTLFGPVALYRVMAQVFPGRQLAVMLASFLIPSFLYWTSGLHKDGFIFVGLALICYHMYFGMSSNSFPMRRWLVLLLGGFLVLGLRNFYVLPLIPALAAWILAAKVRWKAAFVFLGVYALVGIIFFTAKYVDPRFDFAEAVVEKQQAFLKLDGNSSVAVNKLEPTLASFVTNTPQALSLSVRPFPADVHHLLSLAAALEMATLFIICLLFIFWRMPGPRANPVLLFGLFFAFSLLLMIGYSVNNIGAIVRYRSIILPFIIVPLMARIDWNRIARIIQGDIK